ncbi:MAG: hypothetical protein LQ340_000213 [Diploschistes diacapsis]|nr:MAG: hypothetical protein LQ340_000213 [Diploschistes diacapsis]
MSGSAALEYGFPSTHSTNAVSVAVYAILCLRSMPDTFSPMVKPMLEVGAYFYAISIVAGRVYCGMHGIFDVIIGSLLGAALSIIEVNYIEAYERFLGEGSLKAVIIVILIILVLVRIHPEPADDCPCFDDSVAFAGVFMGVEFGLYHYAKTPFSWDAPVPATVPYDLETLGWPKTVLRVCLGVLLIFVWKGIMKPALLMILPPIFRIVERLGLTLPRKFFIPATSVFFYFSQDYYSHNYREYDHVPGHIRTDNVIPSVSELPNFLSRVRHPRRSRSISVGPQSAADAYEALAFRREMRKEMQGFASGATTEINATGLSRLGFLEDQRHQSESKVDSIDGTIPDLLSVDHERSTDTLQQPIIPVDNLSESSIAPMRSLSQDRRQNEKEEREMLSLVPKPRVRYDVEVITKLIVYSGGNLPTGLDSR